MQIDNLLRNKKPSHGSGWDDVDHPVDPFGSASPWSRGRAEAWRRTQPVTSPWRVVAAQALAGIACAAVFAAATQRAGPVASSAWGAATAVLPSALLARGMTRGVRNPMAAAAGFMFWEMLKIGVAIARLAIASKVVRDLSWPALLITLFVCIKVNWIALLGRGKRPGSSANET